MMLTQSDIPFRLDEITAGWLTRALRSSGLLKNAEVIKLNHRIIGEETGFLGLVVILEPTYSEEEAQAPESLVLKIPTPLKNRRMGQSMGVYEKEIRFYRELKPKLPVRTPAHFYSALNAFDDPDLVLERLRKLHRLPLPLIALLAVAVTWFIGLFPRRYVLLIEDVSHLRMGDQLNGCSENDVRRVLGTMAALHARFWESEELATMKWVAPVELTSKLIHLTYLQSVEKYKRASQSRLAEREIRLINWLKINGVRLTEVQAVGPRTLLHGDFRLDNLCFDDATDEVLVMDWQTLVSGSAGMDLAYFLSAALPLETTEAEINSLIEYYRQCLQQGGVEISVERLRWQYEVGMLSMLHKIAPILFQEQLELGTGRGPELMQGWIDKTFRKLEAVDFEHIFEKMPT
jgi:thiamine kinase-like enzyme